MIKSRLIKHICGVAVAVAATAIFIILLKTGHRSLYGGIATSQYFYLLAIGSLCAVVVSLQALFIKSRLHWGDIGVVAMLVYLVVHSYFSESTEGRELYMSLAYFSIYFLARTAKVLKLNQYLSFAIMGIGAWQSLEVLSQLWGDGISHHSRFAVTGSFYNPGPCGIFLSAIFAFAMVYVKKGARGARVSIINIRYALACLTATISFIALGATLSRAGWVGACIAVLILYRKEIASWFKDLKSKLIYIISLGLALMIIIGVYSIKRDSANGRLFIWQNTLSAIAETPIFGVGVDKFTGVYAQHQHNFFAERDALLNQLPQAWVADTPQSVFNEPLALLLLLGIVGALIAGFILYHKFRQNNDYIYIVVALLVGSLFSYPFYIPAIGALFVIALAQLPDSVIKETKISALSYNIVVSGLCMLIAYACYDRHKDIEAFEQWQELFIFYRMENYESVVEDYSMLYSTLSYSDIFLFEYGRTLSKLGEYSQSNEILIEGARCSSDPMFWNVIGDNYQALNQYDRSAEAYLRAYHICPIRIYPLYLLTKLYHNTGDSDKMRFYAEILLNKEIKIPSPAVDDMRAEIKELIKP